MGRPFIVLGDQTDHGGQVIEASGMSFIHGRRIARVGDKVTCPKRGHGHTTVIVTGDPTMIVDGQPVARHGDQCACGAILIASQGVAGAGSAEAPAAPQRPNVEAEVARGLAVQQGLKTRPAYRSPATEPRRKIFWKTTRSWADSDITDFQQQVPTIAERLRTEQYWNKNGEIKHNRFTCEDFAIRLLCEYACQHGLPVKLTTGVRTYRNEEPLRPVEHKRYGSNLYGFTEMVMLSYGAPDMQRVGVNTVVVPAPETLLQGDVLAQANDLEGRALAAKRDSPVNVGHHIQVVVSVADKRIAISQGNSDGSIHFIFPKALKLVGRNPADPQDDSYAGRPIESGLYSKRDGSNWSYDNQTTKRHYDDKLKEFLFYRWNFYEFNN
jgi:uncharacterized Zn-binding protein involved in type VI secretion